MSDNPQDWPEENRIQVYATERPGDRRSSRRVRLDLETAVPVLVREMNGTLQWGLARNISEGGMLIELKQPPAIGAHVEIKIFGVNGSADAPDNVIVFAEVRHNLAWNFAGDETRAGLSAVGVRFCSPPEDQILLPPAGSPVH